VTLPYCCTTHPHALIVAKNESLSNELKEMLSGIKEFETIGIVQDCLQALEYVHKNLPGTVIFDADVSVLEVLNALRTVKAISHEIQCIVIADHLGYHALMTMVGADYILYRGFSKNELAGCID
jgi:two-component SAPR family response regulator